MDCKRIAAVGPVSKNDEFCIQNEEFCIQNEEFCFKNDEFCRLVKQCQATNVPTIEPAPVNMCMNRIAQFTPDLSLIFLYVFPTGTTPSLISVTRSSSARGGFP